MVSLVVAIDRFDCIDLIEDAEVSRGLNAAVEHVYGSMPSLVTERVIHHSPTYHTATSISRNTDITPSAETTQHYRSSGPTFYL